MAALHKDNNLLAEFPGNTLKDATQYNAPVESSSLFKALVSWSELALMGLIDA